MSRKKRLEPRRYTVLVSGEMREALEKYRSSEAIPSSIAKLVQIAVVEKYCV